MLTTSEAVWQSNAVPALLALRSPGGHALDLVAAHGVLLESALVPAGDSLTSLGTLVISVVHVAVALHCRMQTCSLSQRHFILGVRTFVSLNIGKVERLKWRVHLLFMVLSQSHSSYIVDVGWCL